MEKNNNSFDNLLKQGKKILEQLESNENFKDIISIVSNKKDEEKDKNTSEDILKDLIEKENKEKTNDFSEIQEKIKNVLISNIDAKQKEKEIKQILNFDKETQEKETNGFFDKIKQKVNDFSRNETIDLIASLLKNKNTNQKNESKFKYVLSKLSNSELRAILFALIGFIIKTGKLKQFMITSLSLVVIYKIYNIVTNKDDKKDK